MSELKLRPTHAAMLGIDGFVGGVQKLGLDLPQHFHHMGRAFAFQARVAAVELVGEQIVVLDGGLVHTQCRQQQGRSKAGAVFARSAVKHLWRGLLQQVL